MRTSEDGVSAAIAGVLLIALVLIGFVLVGSFIMGQPLPEKVPKVQFGIKQVNDTTLVLVHEGGEALQHGSFKVLVDGTERSYSIQRPGAIATQQWWNVSSYVLITIPSGTVKSVALSYSGGSGETLLRSSNSPWGYYVFPSYDPNETVDLPLPDPTPLGPGDVPRMDWPPNETAQVLFPQENGMRIFVAAENSDPGRVNALISEGNRVFVCNGGADEQEINDALSLARGGVVELLSGNFEVSGRIFLQKNTTLQGAGSGATILRIRDPSRGPNDPGAYLPVTVNKEFVNLIGFKTEGHGFIMITASHVRVRDVWATSVLNGERYKAAGNGMFFVWAAPPHDRVDDIEFFKCIAFDCNTHGWNMNQDYSDKVARNITNVRLVSCTAQLCGYGVEQGSRSPWITGYDLHEWQDLQNVEVRGCLAINNWESGFHLEPGARYGDDGGNIGPRTISRNISFIGCHSEDNGRRNTDPSRFFMSGYYLSRDTSLIGCTSKNNMNAGYYVHGGDNALFEGCKDDGSTFGWKICKASEDITLNDCESWNNARWGIWASFSTRLTVTNFDQYNTHGDRGYQNILGWYKDEPKYQLPVTNSIFEMTAHPESGIPVINRDGSGNSYHIHYAP